MHHLVETDQSAFLKGRYILDNIVTAEELLFSIHQRRVPGHILKVDFAKAFDMMDWEFLFELLEARGFGGLWISWIKCILTTLKTNILINGSPNGYTRYKTWAPTRRPAFASAFLAGNGCFKCDVLPCTEFQNFG